MSITRAIGRLHRRYDDLDAWHPFARFTIFIALVSPAFVISDGHFALMHPILTIAVLAYLLALGALRMAHLNGRLR